MLNAEQMAERLSEQEFDPEVLGGSIKRKIVNPMLVAERAKCNFDKNEGYNTLYSSDQRFEFDFFNKALAKRPELASKTEVYEMTREEKFKEWWDRLKVIMADPELRTIVLTNSHKKSKYFNWFYLFAGSCPMTLHMQMFTKSIKDLGSEEQVRHYLPLVNHWQIIGCYA